jgi:hypothetical protein
MIDAGMCWATKIGVLNHGGRAGWIGVSSVAGQGTAGVAG